MGSNSGNGQGTYDDQKPLDIDALLNRAAVSFARSQRLVDSWLPTSDADKTPGQTSKVAQDSNQDSSELSALAGRPERAGLGAEHLSQNGSLRATGVGEELEKLRSQMLGRKARKRAVTDSSSREIARVKQPKLLHSPPVKGSGAGAGSKEVYSASGASSGDDEDGRTSAVGSKRGLQSRKRTSIKQSSVQSMGSDKPGQEQGTLDDAEEEPEPAGSTANDGPYTPTPTNTSKDSTKLRANKRSSSYLDEILARRESKKKKKKQKHVGS